MASVTATHFLFFNYNTRPIRTKRESSQYHRTASDSFLRKTKQNHKKRKSSQRKVTNARSLSASLHPVFYFRFFILIHRHRKRVASRQTWWRVMGASWFLHSQWILSELLKSEFKDAASLLTFSQSHEDRNDSTQSWMSTSGELLPPQSLLEMSPNLKVLCFCFDKLLETSSWVLEVGNVHRSRHNPASVSTVEGGHVPRTLPLSPHTRPDMSPSLWASVSSNSAGDGWRRPQVSLTHKKENRRRRKAQADFL